MLLLAHPAHADVTGKPRVVDGDTIHIGKNKIRLHGIDALEMKETCRTSKGKEQKCGYCPSKPLSSLSEARRLPVRVISATDTSG